MGARIFLVRQPLRTRRSVSIKVFFDVRFREVECNSLMKKEKEKGPEAEKAEMGPLTPEETEEPKAAAAEGKTEEAKPTLDLAAACRKLEEEKQELYDRLLRKQAELENFRKRTQREREEFAQHANADLLRSLLPALDGFDRALKHRDANVPQQFYEGLELIYRQLFETLRRAGLATVEAEGTIFDPAVHQAVETVESTEHRDHEVIEELQRGYQLKRRLLRPAIVKVAVHPRRTPATQPAEPRAEHSQGD